MGLRNSPTLYIISLPSLLLALTLYYPYPFEMPPETDPPYPRFWLFLGDIDFENPPFLALDEGVAARA